MRSCSLDVFRGRFGIGCIRILRFENVEQRLYVERVEGSISRKRFELMPNLEDCRPVNTGLGHMPGYYTHQQITVRQPDISLDAGHPIT